jgi:hypothetical protein
MGYWWYGWIEHYLKIKSDSFCNYLLHLGFNFEFYFSSFAQRLTLCMYCNWGTPFAKLLAILWQICNRGKEGIGNPPANL